MDTLLYAGSFDPVTRGHMDVIRRAAALCPELVVAVMHNPEKHGFLPVPMRVELLETACRGLHNVRVIAHGGLLIDCAHEVGATGGHPRPAAVWATLKANIRWRR